MRAGLGDRCLRLRMDSSAERRPPAHLLALCARARTRKCHATSVSGVRWRRGAKARREPIEVVGIPPAAGSDVQSELKLVTMAESHHG